MVTGIALLYDSLFTVLWWIYISYIHWQLTWQVQIDKLYSPQMIVTIYKYIIENDLTKKREKRKKETQINGMYLSKQDM